MKHKRPTIGQIQEEIKRYCELEEQYKRLSEHCENKERAESFRETSFTYKLVRIELENLIN